MNPDARISLDDVVVAVSDQLTCDLAGEAAILHLPDGVYYGLNQTGAFVWERLQNPVRVGELLQALLGEFEISEEVAAKDLFGLLLDLQGAKLIEVRDAAAP
jgi:hypothetical protein